MSEHCKIHTDTELVVVKYCPVCRGQHGGASSAKSMSKADRKRRAQKAAQARWGNKPKAGGKK